MLKKFISTLVLICVMTCCFSFNVFAETTVDDEIALMNLYTNKISTNITRSSSKKISYDCSVTGKSTATQITLYLYLQENVNGSKVTVDIARISCILCGIIFVVVGNYMTKAKRNTVVGFRTAWSMYNDNTWRKSNRFGAIRIVVAGVLTIITAAFANGITSTILLLVYLLSATIIAILYSKKVYDQEKREV